MPQHAKLVATHVFVGSRDREKEKELTIVNAVTNELVAALHPRQALQLAADLVNGALRVPIVPDAELERVEGEAAAINQRLIEGVRLVRNMLNAENRPDFRDRLRLCARDALDKLLAGGAVGIGDLSS